VLLARHVRGLFEETTARIAAVKSEERSIEHRQRDIYDSHRHRIFSLAYHMTGNELEAEQVLIQSFVQAFASDPKPDCALIDGSLISELRRYFPLTPSDPAPLSVSAEISGRNIRRTDLEEAIQGLPPCERLLFLLRDVEGYTTEAISQLVGMTQQQVNRTLFSAKIRLRSILAEMEASRAA
jgi:RNA polymerase sigma-70 factor (ECF subfamily)